MGKQWKTKEINFQMIRKKLISKTNSTSCKIFNNSVLIRRKDRIVYLNKPIYLGASILDL